MKKDNKDWIGSIFFIFNFFMNTSEVLRYNRQGGGFTSLKLIMFEKILVLKMHY